MFCKVLTYHSNKLGILLNIWNIEQFLSVQFLVFFAYVEFKYLLVVADLVKLPMSVGDQMHNVVTQYRRDTIIVIVYSL